MPDARLPIKIERIPSGYTVNLADGRKLLIDLEVGLVSAGTVRGREAPS